MGLDSLVLGKGVDHLGWHAVLAHHLVHLVEAFELSSFELPYVVDALLSRQLLWLSLSQRVFELAELREEGFFVGSVLHVEHARFVEDILWHLEGNIQLAFHELVGLLLPGQVISHKLRELLLFASCHELSSLDLVFLHAHLAVIVDILGDNFGRLHEEIKRDRAVLIVGNIAEGLRLLNHLGDELWGGLRAHRLLYSLLLILRDVLLLLVYGGAAETFQLFTIL